MSAVRNNDRVGLMLFTEQPEHVVPPGKGRRHVLRLMRDLLSFIPTGSGTSIGTATDFLARTLPHRSIVFLISDFVDPTLERPLKLLTQRHDVVAVSLEDPKELELPDVGLARFRDPESGQDVSVDTSDPTVRAFFARHVEEERNVRRTLFRRLGMDQIPVRTDRSYVEPLLRFFRMRETRRRH
jgi:uncharacterized protein (DUF58 family)